MIAYLLRVVTEFSKTRFDFAMCSVHHYRAIQFSAYYPFCLKRRNREITPTVRCRDSEIPPTVKLNDPSALLRKRLTTLSGECYSNLNHRTLKTRARNKWINGQIDFAFPVLSFQSSSGLLDCLSYNSLFDGILWLLR